MAAWAAQEPALVGVEGPGDLAERIRRASPGHQDHLTGSLLRVAAADDLAQLVVAGLSRRLQSVVAHWSCAGVDPTELAVLEADLVTGCWEAVATASRATAAGSSRPPRPGLALVDAAREGVRVPRRRHRRAAAGRAPLTEAAALAAPDTNAPVVELTRHLVAAVHAGQLSVPAASLISTTRVAGWTVAETARRLGTTPESVRALRSRAERRLIATAA